MNGIWALNPIIWVLGPFGYVPGSLGLCVFVGLAFFHPVGDNVAKEAEISGSFYLYLQKKPGKGLGFRVWGLGFRV